MKRFAIWAIMGAIFFLTKTSVASESTLLKKYFYDKAKYERITIDYEKEAPPNESESKRDKRFNDLFSEDKAAIAKLHPILRQYFGETKFPGFLIKSITPQPGSLIPEAGGGYGCVEGLSYALTGSDAPSEVVKTDVFMASKLLKTTPEELRRLERLKKNFKQFLCEELGHDLFGDVPIDDANSIAFLSVGSQEIGPFLPNELIVISLRKNQIYVSIFNIEKKSVEIKKCTEIWDKAYLGNFDNEEKAYKEYQDCYSREQKGSKMSADISKLANSVSGFLPR